MHVLGIDAGGTKTVCLLAGDDGKVLAEARGPGANLQIAGELEVEKVLHQVMERALDGCGLRPSAICLGIAGVDREDDARIVTAIMRRISPGSRVLVVNDALVALEAGTSGPGVVIVAGTGSIAYGRDASGHAARSGGWGHIVGDEGSGYWIGRRAVAAVLRAADGRAARTDLEQRVLSHFGVSTVPGLVHAVYGRDATRLQIAALGPIVDQSRQAGDATAMAILDAAADELTLAAASVTAQLQMNSTAFPFVSSGGVFNVVPWLVTALRVRLLSIAPFADVRHLQEEPARGAVSLALAELRGGAIIPKYV